MRNNLNGDVTVSYKIKRNGDVTKSKRMKIYYLNVSHKYNSNSLAAVLHINKSKAAGNSKKVVHPWVSLTGKKYGGEKCRRDMIKSTYICFVYKALSNCGFVDCGHP